MQPETVKLEKVGGIAVLTLNRPERLNAINWQMNSELRAAWDDIRRDEDVFVAVVTGAGDRAFCTGWDMTAVAHGETVPAGQDKGDHVELLFTAIQNKCWKPVVTAVNGMVTGGGLHFIADSDLIVAADNATFFDSHVRVGHASVAESIGLARRIPMEAVFRMAFMGGAERFTAQRAYEIGLVGEVVPKGNLMERAMETAQKIMQNSPSTVITSKKAIWEGLNYGLDAAIEHGWTFLQAHQDNADRVEGATAFLEKRKPNWLPAPFVE